MTHRSSTISAATTDTVNAPEKKLRRVRMTTSAWIAVSILAFWILVLVFAPLIAPFGEGDMVSTQSFAYP